MKTSEINITVELDGKGVPERIRWDAPDRPDDVAPHTKALALSLWDDNSNQTINRNIWDKKVQVGEMKRFVINTMVSLAETLEFATGDQQGAADIRALCEELARRVVDEEQGKGRG
ncbi:MAG: gliding motility protein GldC [Catalinimonas sp.]